MSLFILLTEAQTSEESSAYKNLNLPNLAGENLSGQVVIAVIDDGFLPTHNSLGDFLWINDKEIPFNGKDDDRNGYVDDHQGWDLADSDYDVALSPERQEDLYHGTMISSIIAQVASESLGEKASAHIKIMPIKVLSDYGNSVSMSGGYQGIEYAIANGADIICLAWSGGEVTFDQAALVDKAAQSGVLLLASAGNAYSPKLTPPAALSRVYSVAAHDRNFQKTGNSNYSADVDLIAGGEDVKAAHSTAENAYFQGKGTSAAVALVTGVSAVLKLVTPEADADEIMAALKNTAIPLDSFNPNYLAQLGAGRVNASAALDYLGKPEEAREHFNPIRTQGRYYLSGKQQSLGLSLPNGIKGIKVWPGNTSRAPSRSILNIWIEDSLYKKMALRSLINPLELPSSRVRLTLERCRKPERFFLNYHGIAVDSSSLYCSEVTELTDTTGVISDGSGLENYANSLSCQWVLRPSNGKSIKLDFEKFSTEPGIDQVLIFNGAHPLQENLVARFSGENLPPVIITASNEIMIWFISDNQHTEPGWQLRYATTAQTPGVYQRYENPGSQ